MEVTVKMPGTCGELAEGVVDGFYFHITCPIAKYSRVRIRRDDLINGIKMQQSAPKTLEAIKKTLAYYNCSDIGLEVSLQSELRVAKGMASSTADIVAAIVAITLLLKKEPDNDLIKELALAVEPTDGSFMSGIVAFDHFYGQKVVSLGEIEEEIPLLIFDAGGEVDTVQFGQRPDLKELNAAKEAELKRAYQLIKQGIKKGRPELIGQGATISSLANQKLLFKPYLEELIQFAKDKDDILGVNIAHTGTVIGVLMEQGVDLKELKREIVTKLPQLSYLMQSQIINGGYSLI